MTWIHLLLVVLITGFASGFEGLGKLPRQTSRELVQDTDDNVEIIHGKKASIKKFPYMAALIVNDWVGSGVILNKHWILTTAFNVAWLDPSGIQFQVGSGKYDKGGQILTAKTVVYHENYTGSWDYDIAVVKLEKPIKFSRKVKPIKLATDQLKNKTIGTVAGWGEAKDKSYTSSSSLLTTKVTVLDKKTCTETYGSELTPRLLCTFDKKVGPCVYDYGDPLVVNGRVHGLYAGGVSCTPGENPVLYADVATLHKWVKQAIK